jgi:photosystem II stability/assembly factor-like uncharacterized protein
MNAGCRRNAAVIGGLLLLCSLGFGAWEQMTSGSLAQLYSVHFPEGTQVGYAAGVGPDTMGGESAVILNTTDGGTTWAPQSPGVPAALNSIYFKDNSNGFAVGAAGTALKTTDGGASWTTMTMPGGIENTTLTSIRFPENGQIGYIGVYPRAAPAKALKSTDGGNSWTEIPVGGPMNWSYGCSFATDNIGVVFGKGGFVYWTTDGLGSAQVQGPNTIADLVGAAFSPEDPNKAYLIGNDSTAGLVRYTATGGLPLWDFAQWWPAAAFHGIDMPTFDFAFICGDGCIEVSASADDFYRTTLPLGVTVPIFGLCFPNGADTGYAVGGGGTILRTYDGGKPWIPGVAEGKAPAITRAGVRVVSNPCRRGIALLSEADVPVAVFDAAGRAVMRQAATKGLSFLPVPTGAYFVKAGAQTARVVVTD